MYSALCAHRQWPVVLYSRGSKRLGSQSPSYNVWMDSVGYKSPTAGGQGIKQRSNDRLLVDHLWCHIGMVKDAITIYFRLPAR